MSGETARPTVGETLEAPPHTHPVFTALADARGRRPVVLFFLRAFS